MHLHDGPRATRSCHDLIAWSSPAAARQCTRDFGPSKTRHTCPSPESLCSTGGCTGHETAQTIWKRSSPRVCISVRGLAQTLRTWRRRHPWSDLQPLTERFGKCLSSGISLLNTVVRTCRERNHFGIVHRTQESRLDLVLRATVKQPVVCAQIQHRCRIDFFGGLRVALGALCTAKTI